MSGISESLGVAGLVAAGGAGSVLAARGGCGGRRARGGGVMVSLFWWVVLLVWNMAAAYDGFGRLDEQYRRGGRGWGAFCVGLAVLNFGASAYCAYVIDGKMIERYGGRVATSIPTTIGPPSPEVK